ncbi:hypothetical protein DM860_012212 [Cuscuta australis]|uniref:Remorin C-terminal domain-containing protein n=1 Tax=Cuscuta australis TaxID=267555 RepID=A0A328E6T6_9ASTE|nr:hypothetical protein DM860_012212 [Cuscuta australis]
MPELGFRHRRQARAGDFSPVSVIFEADSNFSPSSTSGSIHLSSFAYDTRDIEGSWCGGPHTDLAGDVYCKASGCPASDLNKNEHAKDNRIAETGDKGLGFDLASTSFSQALKECHDRRSRTEYGLIKSDRQRTNSADMKNSLSKAANSSSPQCGVMKKPSISNRRQLNAQFLPHNKERTLPSKWADAERWIFSPLLRDDAMRTSVRQPQEWQKSKSGHLCPPVLTLYSPTEPVRKERKGIDLQGSSPFLSGVIASCTDLPVTRSISVQRCPDNVSLSSFTDLQDENDSNKVTDTAFSRIMSRDMTTPMSPEGSHQISPRRCSTSPNARSSILPIDEAQSCHSSKTDISNVLVNERVTLTRWRKKHRIRIPRTNLDIVDYWKNKALGMHSYGWEASATANTLSKVKSEEARISAWENLQKAKAEAAIQKFEVKLQNKRSASMDKIMNKLRSAQKKAQEMRTSMLASQNREVVEISHRALALHRTHQRGPLSGCFTCHAF